MPRPIATEHVWRTETGRHVPAGHPDAAFLAAAPGDEIPDEVITETEPKKKGRKPKEKPEPGALETAGGGDETGGGDDDTEG